METHVDFELLGYRWTVKPEFARVFRETLISLALSGEESSRLRAVTRKLARKSFIASGSEFPAEMFVKAHAYEKTSERIKTLMLPSRARVEWDMGNQMFDGGLPVAEPLGFGERRSGGVITGCVFVQRALPRCANLGRYLGRQRARGAAGASDAVSSAPELSEILGELAKSLGDLVAKMHSAGFRHADLHTGNIMVEAEAPSLKLWLVDLHSVRRYSSLSLRRRMADLAKLTWSLKAHFGEPELYEMLHAYAPSATTSEIENTLADLQRAAAAIEKLRVKSRSKRCVKTSGKFVVERNGAYKLYRRREYGTDAVLAAVEQHRHIRDSGESGLVKTTPKGAVTSFSLSDGVAGYVKEFKNQGFARLLETMFYVPRGRKAWKAGHRLRLLGVPCAELVALVEEHRFGMVRSSYMIMKEIPDATRLNAFLMRTYFRVSGHLTPEEALQKRELIRLGAQALRALHAKNIYHKDLSAKNVLVGHDSGGAMRFYFVDLDSIEFPPWLSLRRRIKNLAQLNGLPGCITTADRVRFYMEYFGLHTLTPKHKQRLQKIRRMSGHRREHSRRIDARVRKRASLDDQTYEDITSL
jgi:tRNA A-37 threonylcarbamoyl transferase component Bud32